MDSTAVFRNIIEPSEMGSKHDKSQVRSQESENATQAPLFDKAIGNTLWLDAIQKRYKNERLH
jgi:hypothetical protein